MLSGTSSSRLAISEVETLSPFRTAVSFLGSSSRLRNASLMRSERVKFWGCCGRASVAQDSLRNVCHTRHLEHLLDFLFWHMEWV